MNAAATVATKGLSLAMLLLLAAGLVLLEQVTKSLAVTNLDYGVPLTVFPGFDLLLVHNFGAAFSFLDNAGGGQRWLLAGISIIVSAAIAVWLWRLPRGQTLLAVALAAILGGALGNLYDRVAFGYVVDFISVYVGEWRFATFNVADMGISIGAALMALDVFLGAGDHDRREA